MFVKKRMFKHIPASANAFPFQEQLFLFPNLTAMHFPKLRNHFSVNFFAKINFSPKRHQIIRFGMGAVKLTLLMQVHRLNVIYDPGRGLINSPH